MSRNLFDDIARDIAGFSAIDRAMRHLTAIDRAMHDLTAASAVHDMARSAAQVIEEETIAHSLSKIAEEGIVERAADLLCPSHINDASFHLKQAIQNASPAHSQILSNEFTFNGAMIAEKASFQSLGAGTATTLSEELFGISKLDVIQDAVQALGVREATLGQGVESNHNLTNKFTERLNYRHHFIEDSLSSIAMGARAVFQPIATIANDHLMQATRTIAEGYRFIQSGQLDSNLFADELQRLQETQLIGFAPITTLASQLADVLHAKIPVAAFDTTFTGALLSRLHEAEAITSASEREAFLDDFLSWLAGKIQQLPETKLSFEGVVNLLVAVLMFLYSAWDSNQTKQILLNETTQIRRQIEQHRQEEKQGREEILRKLDEIKKAPSSRNLYVVMKKVNLRESPTTESRIIQMLSVNTVVEEVEQQGEWLFVEFLDYTDLKLERGWVYRKRLKHAQCSSE